MRRVGETSTPESSEEIKLEIEGLRTEIENEGNSIVNDLEVFLNYANGSEDTFVRDEARVVLQQLKGFTLKPDASATSGSAIKASRSSAPAGSSTSKQEAVKQRGTSWLKRIIENAREDTSTKSTTPEPKA